MAYEDILVEAKEKWIEITLNRPAKLNAFREKRTPNFRGE